MTLDNSTIYLVYDKNNPNDMSMFSTNLQKAKNTVELFNKLQDMAKKMKDGSTINFKEAQSTISDGIVLQQLMNQFKERVFEFKEMQENCYYISVPPTNKPKQ